MAQLGTFNPDAVEDNRGDFEPLPPGMYTAQIIASELAATKSGSGQMLKLTLEIVEGPAARRQVWDNLNIVNGNAQAQEIAQRTLKRICNAVGHVGVLTDSDGLHFKPMRVRLAIEEDRSGQYGPRNAVKAYEPMGGRPAAPAQTQSSYSPPTQAAPAQASGGASRPWR